MTSIIRAVFVARAAYQLSIVQKCMGWEEEDDEDVVKEDIMLCGGMRGRDRYGQVIYVRHKPLVP